MKTGFTLIALSIFMMTHGQSPNKEEQLKHLKEFDSIKKVAQKERDSFMPLNLIDKHYKYLNDDFNIVIDSSAFKRVIDYYPVIDEVETYKDSLMRILIYELKSTRGANIAFHRILFKWEKLSYYIWKSEEETKLLGQQLGFQHPYRFHKYLMDSTVNSIEKYKLLNGIKAKLAKVDSVEMEIKPYNKFLDYAFKINPERIKAMNAYLKKHSRHKH